MDQRLRRRTALPLVAALLVTLLPASVGRWPAGVVAQDERPNIIVIVTDDQDAASIEQMPNTVELLQEQGLTLPNFFAATPNCCPSRATILRGQYPHNHGVLSNQPPNGGVRTFQELDRDQSTVATWLDDAGYRTGLVGKYLNGYEDDPSQVPPGWDDWFAWAGEGTFDSYRISDNGRPVTYDEMPADYETDVYGRRSVEFIESATADGEPFFLYVAPHAPHLPATPAPRDADAFATETAPRSPSFNEEDVADKPAWVRNSPRLTDDQAAQIDALLPRSAADPPRGRPDDRRPRRCADGGRGPGQHLHLLHLGQRVLSRRTPPGLGQRRAVRGEHPRLAPGAGAGHRGWPY